MSFKLDKKTVIDLMERKVSKILVFFYDAGCSGTKLDITEDFEVTDLHEKLNLNTSFSVYVEKKDKEKFNGAIITRTISSDHTGEEKIRYIFSNDSVQDRCGCGSSFSFEKKKPKLNLENLKNFKNKFK